MQNIIKLDKKLIEIINIPDMIYTPQNLKKILIKKLKKKTYVEYYISTELQNFLCEPNNYIGIDYLIHIMITNYSENLNCPNCDYYSYNQNPNYDLIK